MLLATHSKNDCYVKFDGLLFVTGGIIGGIVKALSTNNLVDLHQEETFPPTIFFLVMLPPIIFESGYNLHKVSTICSIL